MHMDHKQVAAWFKDWADAVVAQQEYLSDLDNAIGDGDHGYNMAKGLSAYLEARSTKDITSISEEIKLLAMTLLGKVGGASGPIYSSAFLAMAKNALEMTDLDKSALINLLTLGVEAIQNRGKAQRGEKTLVDVWYPVIEDLKQDALTEARIDEHVNATIPMKATKGRASYLGERSIGHIDPGSYSSGLLFKALLKNW